MSFADFDTDLFLRDYWQKRPLLIRNPWRAWINPIEPDELAGLACEPGVEARLMTCETNRPVVDDAPLSHARFGELKNGPWTLLVQAVDHYSHAVANLIEPFRFIPDWRIDDIMVSYASDGGGVGAHFDQYDVFLVQGLGQRRWRVGPLCDADTPLLPHESLRLIADFEATGDWILEPGDILYVPPRYAHHGVAVGNDCMTYSIGFRAPSRAELVEGWCDHLVEGLSDDDRYADPDLVAQDNPGEIGAAAIDRLHAMASEAVSDRAAFVRWFGMQNSLSKYADMDWRPDEPIGEDKVRACLSEGVPLVRNPASRFSFVREDAGILLFVDGQCFPCAGDTMMVAQSLCAQPSLDPDPVLATSPAAVTLIAALIDQGSLAFDEEE